MSRKEEDKTNGDYHFEVEGQNTYCGDDEWICPFCNNTGFIIDEVNGMTFSCSCTVFCIEEEW